MLHYVQQTDMASSAPISDTWVNMCAAHKLSGVLKALTGGQIANAIH